MVTTFVGGVNGTNPSYADGSGTAAGFYYPFNIAYDANNNIILSDSDNQRIRKVTAAGGMWAKVSKCARICQFVGV